MAVITSFIYAEAVLVFTCVYNVHGQLEASPTPCTSYFGDFQCNDGRGCYDRSSRCNAYSDCSDKTDDLNCDSCNGGTGVFYCELSRQCVSSSLVCNGRQDCLMGDDEQRAECYGVRLVNGSVPSEGRVEVFHDGKWGTVCQDGWEIKDANVLCKQLGYTGATTVWGSAHFGQGASHILMDEVNCIGNEDRLQDCASRGWGVYGCTHAEDASVSCGPATLKNCTSGNGDYQCFNWSGCYSDYNKCDSYNQCRDKTDDLNCDSCDVGAFYCQLSRECVSSSLVCDGSQDCPDGEDEKLPECNPTIWLYWTVGQLVGVIIGFILFLVIVIVIVDVVHKNCKE